jgi:hypothetical protein
MTWTYAVPTPVVGEKITAAGWGTSVAESVDELQDRLIGVQDRTVGEVAGTTVADGAVALREWARSCGEVGTIHSTITTATVGGSTVVAAPSSGRRIVRSLLIHAPTTGSSVTLSIAGVSVATLDFAAAGVLAADVVVPLAASETVAVTVSGGTCYVAAGWADRAATDVARLGLINSGSSSPQTLVASGAARTITHLWLGCPGSGTTCTLTVGTSIVLDALPVTTHGLLILEQPIEVPVSTAVTVAADGTNALAAMAVGH